MQEPRLSDYTVSRTDHRGTEVTDDDLLEEIERLHRRLRKIPTTGDLEEHGVYSETAYYNHFGSWNAALQEAGFDVAPNQSPNVPDDQELIQNVRDVAEQLGEPPTTRQYDEHGQYSYETCRCRFGSWRATLDAAGLNSSSLYIETGDLIDDLLDVAADVGRPPTMEDMREIGSYSAKTFQQRFGSWAEALRIAGLPTRRRLAGKTTYGVNWEEKRVAALNRDGYTCQHCGISNNDHQDEYGRGLHVHHIVPVREFEYPEDANVLLNLITLCRNCHDRWEKSTPAIDVDELVAEIQGGATTEIESSEAR